MSTTDLQLNETETHALTNSPTGDPWWCPLGYLEVAKSKGFTVAGPETPAPGLYDPAEHTPDEVNAYLTTADPAEVQRVLAAETAGKNRKTVKAPTAGGPGTPS